ncbi:MAG: O-antigen ligase family protein [Firmicutes bacterium]|nr:O-antigen ligase family protein [Bacillota bacterium]
MYKDKTYMRFLSNCFKICWRINTFLGETKSLLISVSAFSVLGIALVLKPFFDFQYCGYLAIFCLAVSVGCAIKKIPENKKVRLQFLIPVMTLGVLYLISAAIFSDGNRIIIGLSFFLMIPIIGIALCEKGNYMSFFNSFGFASEITFIFILIASVIFAPFFDLQYSSIMLNPNGLSETIVPIITGTIWIIEYHGKEKIKKKVVIFSLILLSFEIVFIILTRSRTGLLALLAILTLWLVFTIIRKRNFLTIIKRIGSLLLLCLIALTIITGPLLKVNQIIINKEYSLLGYAVYFTTKDFIKSYNKEEFNSIVSSESQSEVIGGMVDRIEKGKSANEDISSGRFDIWKNAVESLTLLGHRSDETFSVPERNLETNDAHNMILSIGFQIGYVGSIVAIIFTIVHGICFFGILFRSIKSNNMELKKFHYLIITGAFFTISMLSNTFSPLGSMIGIAFWCAQPIIYGEE